MAMPAGSNLIDAKNWVVEVWEINRLLAAAEARGGSYTAAELEAGRRRSQLSSWLSTMSESADIVEARGGLYRRNFSGVSYWVILDPNQNFSGETVQGWSFRNDLQGDGRWYPHTQANTTTVLNQIQRETGGIAPEYRPGGQYYPTPEQDIPGGGIYDPRTLEPIPGAVSTLEPPPLIYEPGPPLIVNGGVADPLPAWALPVGLGLLLLLFMRK